MDLDLSLPAGLAKALVTTLARPGDEPVPARERPLHVVYGGAHLFTAGTPEKLGAHARTTMETWGADDAAFGRAVGVTDAALAQIVAARVRDKLTRQPVEAMCIDFEDGYGPRADEEEDADAVRAARELAKTPANGVVIGVRIKPLEGLTTTRAVRTLDAFVTAFARSTAGALRPGFSVTLPKVTRPAEVNALVSLLEQIEAATGIATPIPIELMIESPRALIADGAIALPALIAAARGRVIAVHLGAYDLTAELGVTAGDQRLDHPYCDLARMLMQLALAGTDVGVSDGATTILPIARKGAPPDESLTAIHQAWSLHAANVTRAISLGIWQGWDLHPAQLPARYGAVFARILARRADLAVRLRNFVDRATRASRVGQVFDDAATAQALVSFFKRGLACGALDEEDVRAAGLSAHELSMSFAQIARAHGNTP